MKKYLPLILILCLCVIFRERLFYAVLPFVLSLVFCLPLCRLSGKISEKTKLPRKAVGIFLFLSLSVSLFFILRALVLKLVSEAGEISEYLSQNPSVIKDTFERIKEKLSQTGGFLGRLLESRGLEELAVTVEELVSGLFERLYSGILEKFSVVVLNVAGKIPSFLFFCFVFFMSSFYFVTDGEKIFGFFRTLIPDGYSSHAENFVSNSKNVLKKYIGAAFCLCAMTFVITYAGLLLVGYDYSLILAILVAAVDFLPLLGTGVVLLPWSLFCFFNADTKTALALLVIFAVATVAHQISEPKILGKHLGLHPLASLASIYIGVSLFGFAGLFIGLVGAVGLRGILESKSIDKKEGI